MNRRDHLATLKEAGPVILPSMLLCDFGSLEREVRRLEEAGARALHLDVMDGIFVPNFTYGLPIVEAFRRLTDLPIDVHLMISKPELYAKKFWEAGADIITFHIEATDDPEPIVQELRDLDVGVGLAINPKTPVSRLEPYLELCDLALIMSVEAGFGGQTFDSSALEKVSYLREKYGEELLIEIDGGVNPSTIKGCVIKGVDLLVVGSAIFKKEDYTEAMNELNSLTSTSQL